MGEYREEGEGEREIVKEPQKSLNCDDAVYESGEDSAGDNCVFFD